MPGEDTVSLPMSTRVYSNLPAMCSHAGVVSQEECPYCHEKVTPYWHGRPPFVVMKRSVPLDWEQFGQPGVIIQVVPVPQLTEEEERLLVAFRKFKAMLAQPEGEFRWKTQQEPGVIPAPERFLIVDPKEDWNAR